MKKAFTLVELLVAVVLLTLLIGTALFAYRQALVNIKKSQNSTFNETLKLHQLRTSIESMPHYVVDNYNQFHAPMKELHPFFNGKATSLTYITKNPTYFKMTTLTKISCEDNTLTYFEEPLYRGININSPKFTKEVYSKIYWKEIAECQIRYYLLGEERERLNDILPTAIEISFIDKKERRIRLYTNIKSDYNISVGVIYEHIYGE